MTILEQLTELECKAKAAMPGRIFTAQRAGQIEPEFRAAANPSAVLELCAALRKAVAALEPIANIDVDFIPKDEPFRHLIMKARACLKEIGK